MTEKHPSEMNDSEFAAALHRKEWRTQAARPQPEPTPEPVQPASTSSTAALPESAPHKATKAALSMTDEEYEIARRTHAWRTPTSTI